MGILEKAWKILENILHFIIYKIFYIKLNDDQWKISYSLLNLES